MLELALTDLAGDPDSAQVLVVGPSLGTAVEALWAECAAHLGDRYQVIGWDLPGHGHSSPATAAFTISDLATEVRGAAGQRSHGRACWYAGVSLGGAVGFELALNPAPFEAIAAIASGAKIGDPTSWQERARLVRRAGTSVMVDPSARSWFAPTFAGAHPDRAEVLLDGLRRTDPQSYAWACEALATFDRRSAVEQVEVPMLVAAGTFDEVAPPARARETARAPQVECRVVPDCGHLPPAEQPIPVAKLLHEFFARQTRPRRSQRWCGDLHAALATGTSLSW